MLFSTIQEIRAYMPTSKWAEQDFPTLQTLLDEEEEYLAAHHLGYSLHEKLCEDYIKVTDDLGGVLATQVDNPDLTVKILRDCQRVILFRMLANNSGIFSVSFNKGGGINMMSAQDYDPADKEHIKNFERDAWGKARRNIENLLLHLEADAKKDRIYTDLWRDSEYYFYHKDLLFTTASDLNHYLNIDNSRERYVQLRPKMRQLQTAHLISAIGNPLWQDLLKVSQGESQAIASPLAESETTEPASVSGDPNLDNTVLTDLKISLANYLEDTDTGNKSKTGNPLLDAANRHRALAVQTILDNADDFDKYITKGSPLAYAYKDAHDGEEYIPIADRPTEETEDTAPTPQAQPAPFGGRGASHSYDRHNPHNAVFDFGGFGHKR